MYESEIIWQQGKLGTRFQENHGKKLRNLEKERKNEISHRHQSTGIEIRTQDCSGERLNVLAK